MKETKLTILEIETAIKEAFRTKNPDLKDEEFEVLVHYDSYYQKVTSAVAKHI